MHSVRIPLRPRHLCLSSHIRAGASRAVPLTQVPRRCRHDVPGLPYDIDGGLGDFMSPAALRVVAVEYQQGLLTRLNEQVKGTEMEGQTVVQTVISSAAHRRHALAFNYASQALNNSFFLQYLTPPPNESIDRIGELDDMRDGIRGNFGSVEQLQSTFSAAALGMINSGWVWLVSDEKGNMQVVATFGAGTLLVRSRRHMLEDERKPILGEPRISIYKAPGASPSQEASSAASPASGVRRPPPGMAPATPYRTLFTSPSVEPRPHAFSNTTESTSAKEEDPVQFDSLGDILTPLLCVSVHEHAWMGAGYGVWGKEEYLKRFWTVVNWRAVGQAYAKARSYN